MTPWQILELDPTSDLASIKKAYKTQLKKHHPEDDPEGFQRVRTAYEEIIETLNHQDASFSPNVSSALTPSQPTTPNAQPPSDDVVHGWAQYTAIIDDPSQRFLLSRWQEWQETLLLQPLDSQQAIASKVLDDVLEKHWLPGEIVQIFWDVFDWQELLNRNDEGYELGEWLQYRTTLASLPPLEQLTHLSAAEQRATLAFTIPLTRALNAGNIAAIHYWLSQPTCLPFHDCLDLQTTILQCCNSCHWYPPVIHQELLPHLSSPDILTQLSAQQLEIVADTTLKVGDVDAILSVATQMMTAHLFRQAIDLLYQTSCKADERDYALVLAYLLQQQQPLPLAFWRCEHWLNPDYDAQANRSQRWLYQSLFNNADRIFRHHLDFKEETGLLGFLTRALWNSEHGSLVWQIQLLDDLVKFQQELSPFERLLLQLVHQHCVDSLQTLTLRAGAPSLIEKLKNYETDAFLLSDGLTEEEIDSLSATEWMHCLSRHPLIPDSWLDALIDHEKISTDIIDAHDRRLHWVYTTLFQRTANRQFRFSSIYQDQPFKGVFNWVLLFNSYYTPLQGIGGSELLTELTALPAKQQSGPLGHFVAYFGHEHQYPQEWVNGCNAFAQQLVFRSLIDRALTELSDNTHLATLKAMALEGNLESLAALSVHYRYNDLFLATIYWQLFHIYTHDKLQFSEFHSRTQNILSNEVIRLEQNPATIDFAQPEAFVVFIAADDIQQLPTPDDILPSTPNKDAARLVYPMCYLLSILYQGWDRSGYDLYPLNELQRQKQHHSDDERHVIDTAFVHLDRLHQTELNKAIHSEKPIKTFSIGRSMLSIMVFIVAWFFLFDYTLSDNVMKSSVLWWVEVGMLSVAQFGLTWRILRVIPHQRKRSTYIAIVWMCYLLALTFSSPWLAGATCVVHVIRLLCSSRIIYCRGRWRKSAVKNKSVNIAALLSPSK